MVFFSVQFARPSSRSVCAAGTLVLIAALVAAWPLPSRVAAQTSSGARRAATPGILPATVSGFVTQSGGGQPVPNARVTLFRVDLSFFRETRTTGAGSYLLSNVPPGAYLLGVAIPGFDYREISITLPSGTTQSSFALLPESEPGRWDTIGDTLPELFDATDIGALRPNGTVLFCHDTVDPIVFDPVTGAKVFPAGSGTEQGCMNTTLLADGSVLIVGGQNGSAPGSFTNAIPWVKRFRPDNTWVQLADLNLAAGRWYPGLARLNDGSVIAIGGGTAPSAQRTDTCERFNLGNLTWSWTGSTGMPMEFPPVALLFNGKILHTWGGRPQLYDVALGAWTNTGQFVHPNRGYPGHSDHSLIILQDGRAAAIGVNPITQPAGVMVEYYDATSGLWVAGTSPSLRRSQAEVVQLPDGRVLVAGGDQGTTQGTEPNVLGCVKRCDLLAPANGAWRRVADTPEFREYHAVTLLVPDGRVITTGGTQIKFQYGPTSANVDAFSPPYLFRGVRPAISNLSDSTPQRGAALAFNVFPQTTLTSVVLLGVQSTTHWVDGGIPRRLVLQPTQAGDAAQVVLPTDPNVIPLGWYLLFAMVDDIPSRALFVRIEP